HCEGIASVSKAEMDLVTVFESVGVLLRVMMPVHGSFRSGLKRSEQLKPAPAPSPARQRLLTVATAYASFSRVSRLNSRPAEKVWPMLPVRVLPNRSVWLASVLTSLMRVLVRRQTIP